MPSFIGFWELMALAAVLLLLFGPRRLPEIGRSLGRGMREFKESVTTPIDGFEGTAAERPEPHLEEAPGAPRRASAAAAPRPVRDDEATDGFEEQAAA